MRADYVRYEVEEDSALARGHLVITIGEDILYGEEAQINLKDQTGTISSGTLFLQRNNVHLKAAQITRLAEDRYSLKDVVTTTCDQENPPWSFKSQKLDLAVEGYATAINTSFRIKSVPVFYIPYIVFPAKSRRESGLLFPEFAIDQKNGVSLNLPVYWAVSPSSDATFYEHYLSKRGLTQGLEYRYVLEQNSKGILLGNYLHDSLEDDDFNKDGFVRTTANRWWYRGMVDQNLPSGFNALLNLDLVSDRDYLQEFDDRYTGFDPNRQTLFQNFGRTLLDKTSLIRESLLQVNRRWTNYSLFAQGRYFENLDSSQQENTLQILPAASFQAVQQSIPGTPCFLEGNADYVNYWREKGIGAHRLDIFPKAAIPFKWKSYLNLRGMGGLRETIYSVQNYGDISGSSIQKRYPARTLPYYEIDLNTQLDRIFKVNRGSVSKIKHSIVPSVIYTYIPAKDQEKLPNLDPVDRIASQNLLSYSLANYVTVKESGAAGPVYRDIFRFRLTQSYSIKEQRRELIPGENRRPFSSLLLEAEFLPLSNFYLRFNTLYNPYDGIFERDYLMLRASDKRGDSLTAEYVQSRTENLNDINIGASFVITKSVAFDVSSRYSLELKKNLETRATIRYYAQCWGLSVQFSDTLGDKRYSVLFSLYGLGQFGPLEFSGSR